MIAFILTLNIVIILINFWLAWNLLRSLQGLRQLTRTLQSTQQGVQDILTPAPHVIALGQVNIRRFRQSTRVWSTQWQKLEVLITMLLWILRSRR